MKSAKVVSMITVLAYSFHGLPKYVGILNLTGKSFRSGTILELWITKAVVSRLSALPCAVTVFCWLSIGFLTMIKQFWITVAESPKMKSTVPEITQLR